MYFDKSKLRVASELESNYDTIVKDYNKLYSNESVQNDEFSSLDNAYLMHPELFHDKSVSSKKKIKKYKKQTKKLQNLKFKLID